MQGGGERGGNCSLGSDGTVVYFFLKFFVLHAKHPVAWSPCLLLKLWGVSTYYMLGYAILIYKPFKLIKGYIIHIYMLQEIFDILLDSQSHFKKWTSEVLIIAGHMELFI